MSSTFTPNQLPNLKLWLDGADPINNGRPPNQDDPVPFWYDKSSNVNMTCQSINTEPGLYNRSMQFGNGGIRFNKSVYSTGLTDISHNSDVFIVMRGDPSTNHSNICSFYDPTMETFYSLTNTDNKFIIDSSKLERRVISITPEYSNKSIIVQWSVADGKYHVYKNGTRILFSNGFSHTPGGQLNFYLGTSLPDGTNDFVGEIGEVIVYNSQLDLTSRQLVEGYLSWKWNIPLETWHVYYKSPPKMI